MVKQRRDAKFNLIIANNVLQDFILPNPTRTEVRNPENYCYINDLISNQVPAHILENVAVGGDTYGDYILEQAAPATDPHTTHMSSENVADTSSSQRPRRRNIAPATLDEIYVELLRHSELDARHNLQSKLWKLNKQKYCKYFARCTMISTTMLSEPNRTCMA